MLDLIGAGESDEALAATFGEPKAAAASAAYWAGFVVEALAVQRHAPLPTTVQCLRESLGTVTTAANGSVG